MSKIHKCKRCGEDDPSNFYQKNKMKSKCKKCHTMESHHNQRMMKLKAIQYLGGVCKDCGISGSPWIFDFHHLDKTQKSWSWGDKRSSSWVNIKKEIDKCELLCSNCHRIRHQQEWEESLVAHHPFFD